MRTVGKTLKETHIKLDVDDVQDLISEIEEQQQFASEIHETLATGFGNYENVDAEDC